MRFAISPLSEVYASVRALDDPAAGAIHRPWIAETRELIAGDDLALLRALQPQYAYSPDFIHPPPTSPQTRLEDELAAMLRTPAEQIRAELTRTFRRENVPDVLASFIATPAPAAHHLADVIRAYWHTAIGPHWEQVRALLEGDIFYRARQTADGGISQLLADLHPDIRFDGDSLVVRKPRTIDRSLEGRGLLLVPSVFGWPGLRVIFEPPWQPTLIYPARGIATLWEPVRCASQALEALLGARRALVLAGLDAPRTTTELAHQLGVSAPSVSQHLAVLRGAGLVRGSRVGRIVVYARTRRGERLVAGQPKFSPHTKCSAAAATREDPVR